VTPKDKSVDIAILACTLPSEFDHRAFPLVRMLDDTKRRVFNVGVGNEMFLTGLFSPHAGKTSNIPIVRIGNIAAMPTERVLTRNSAQSTLTSSRCAP
jgi:hypothetical protein